MPNGEHVANDLSWMLTPSITTVYDRYARPFGCLVGSALLKMAHGDCITVAFEHSDSILDGFLVVVAGTCHADIRKANYMPAQAMHSPFRAQTCARAGLVEGDYQCLMLEQVTVVPVSRIPL